MATENYWFLDAKASGINHLDCATSQPSAADSTTGWTVNSGAGAANGEFSELYAEVQRASTTFTAGAVPTTIDTTNGNGWRLTGTAKNGTYAAGDWTITFRVKVADGASVIDARMSFLFWKSSNADGSGGEAVGTRQVTSTATNVGTGTTISLAYDPSGGAGLTLSNEYLFLLVACELVETGVDVLIFRQTGAVTPAHGVITTDFTEDTSDPVGQSTALRNSIRRRRR